MTAPAICVTVILGLDPRQPHRAGGGVRAALEGIAVMEAGAREAALPAMAVLLCVDHLVRVRVRVKREG